MLNGFILAGILPYCDGKLVHPIIYSFVGEGVGANAMGFGSASGFERSVVYFQKESHHIIHCMFILYVFITRNRKTCNESVTSLW
jgi:hypothetical protein